MRRCKSICVVNGFMIRVHDFLYEIAYAGRHVIGHEVFGMEFHGIWCECEKDFVM